MHPIGKHSRREFLHRAAAFGGLGAASPMALQLAASGAAAAPAASDYKALVCIYLQGGNDHLAAFTPYDTTSYNALAALRAPLMLDRGSLLPLSPLTAQSGRQIGMHPKFTRAKTLWDQKRLAVVSGVGPMTQPVTKAQLDSGAVPLPSGAASHNDGNSMFHALGIEGTRYGWGGRLLDLMASSNTSPLFASIAQGQNNPFGSGLTTMQFQTSERGVAENITGLGRTDLFGSKTAPAKLAAILAANPTNDLEAAYLEVINRVTSSAQAGAQAFANSQTIPTFTGPDTTTGRDNVLGFRLQTVARLIQQHRTLGAKRQVYFIEMRGYDTHGGQVASLDRQYSQLDVAIGYFQGVLDTIGLANSVTTFTTSEFGRCITDNNSGTDHGWGSASMVFGGAVKGGDLYGRLPEIGLSSPDFRINGGAPSQIPTVSVEQLGATLGKWFGVTDTELNDVFPLLSRFTPRVLNLL